jgi:hypothetical protein
MSRPKLRAVSRGEFVESGEQRLDIVLGGHVRFVANNLIDAVKNEVERQAIFCLP